MSQLPLGLFAATRAIAAGTLAPQDYVKQCYARAEETEPWLRAFVSRHALEDLLAQTGDGEWAGIPVGVKDLVATRDLPTTNGSPIYADQMLDHDAPIVSKIRQLGGVVFGKTVTTEFAFRQPGPTVNFWNRAHTPGGSSSGSAAAVAAGLAPLATGTDTGGSVRQPAAMCGITGIKPTYGRVSRFGMIAFASSLDQGGAMAASAADCAALLSAMSGFDPRDATSLEREADDFVAGMLAPVLPAGRAANLTESRPLAGLRIGLPREYFAQGLSADVEQAVRVALDGLVALGAELHDISLPRTQLTIPAYYVIAPAEASSNLSRFDGVRYGHRAEHYTDLRDLYRKSRAEGFGAEVRRRIMVGTYVLSHGYYDAYYLQAQKLRRLIAEDFDAAFAQVDLIAGPVSPTVAWNLGDKGDDPVASYLADIYTLGASLAGLPGLSMPVGFGAGGRPVGLQLIGPRLAESQLLGVAHRFQLSSDWHLRRPPA
jgi:aspartyl-tRNA(Asn)/glutamyl-tRNA(Gln) amidotransferase subunit A